MAQNENKLTVNGFTFQTEKDANIARLELEKINMLEKRMDYRNRALVVAVYNRAVETNMFRTPVGFQYLGRVREKLLAGGVSEQELKVIALEVDFTSKTQSSYERRSGTNEVQVQESKRSGSLITSVILNVLLVLLVGAMFIITLYSDNPNILNYKNQILNEYASWEQELRDKESELRKWERELQNAENASGSQNEQN